MRAWSLRLKRANSIVALAIRGSAHQLSSRLPESLLKMWPCTRVMFEMSLFSSDSTSTTLQGVSSTAYRAVLAQGAKRAHPARQDPVFAAREAERTVSTYGITVPPLRHASRPRRPFCVYQCCELPASTASPLASTG